MTGIEIKKLDIKLSDIRPLLKDLVTLRELGFFGFKKMGAGSVKIHWNDSGQVMNLKDLNFVNPSKLSTTITHKVDKPS
ncbi:MAG: hypothetical protein U9O94_05230 [Nanoarchaeota archaeon]|nr:hypothetical protein [Nanoarchaeota archaeon]